jgi:hypothetical protein
MAYPHHTALLQELSRPSFVLTIVLNPNLVNLGEMAYPPHSSLLQELSRSSFVLTIVQNPNLVNLLIHTPLLSCKNFLDLVSF